MAEKQEKSEQRTYRILVFAAEKVGLQPSTQKITQRNYELVFEPFGTTSAFYEFDGIILFQGLFEKCREVDNLDLLSTGSRTYIEVECDSDALDRREKELNALIKKGGFACFVLLNEFTDTNSAAQSSDLTKRFLNWSGLRRDNFTRRATRLVSKYSEFNGFVEHHGAASSYFRWDSQFEKDCEVIATTIAGNIVGFILLQRILFVPCVLPQHKVSEFFTQLADAVTGTYNKLLHELPTWVEAFQFADESALIEKKTGLSQQISDIDDQLKILRGYKWVLLTGGKRLVDHVSRVLESGFGLKVERYEEYREDLRIVDDTGRPTVFIEVKGTNGGVKREHINQCDSHRERAGLPEDFASILVINTHIKNARTLSEKDKDIASEQVEHAAKNHVLVLRTFDLLCLLRQLLAGTLKKEDFQWLLKNEVGWVKATTHGYDVRNQ